MYLSQFVPDKSEVLAAVAAMPRGNEGQRAVLVQEAYRVLGNLVKSNAAYELHISLSDAVAAQL